MAQLKMYWFPTTSVPEFSLPEGYSIVNFKGSDEIDIWAECCSKELIGESTPAEAYKNAIEASKDIIPERDIFFIDCNNEHIGTFTAFRHSDDNTGDFHMVGIRPEWRGKGLSKYMAYHACNKLKNKGVRLVHLTTDDWRIPAVKSYLRAGFKPVEYSQGMQDRWENVLESANVDSVDMYYDDGSFYKTIQRKSISPKVKFGVLGAYRGRTMIDYCMNAENAVLVAVCDNNPDVLSKAKQDYGTDGITYYDNFEDFIKHDMDAVVLANYANEHAPFAIRSMKAGKHVMSEVLPVQTLKEAVELIEAVEETGKIYAYAENYCYMPAPRTMRKLVKEGKIGEFEYGEGEYMHNCEPIWPTIAYGDPTHWRNNMTAMFYCTHSLGPLIHISGMRPVRVSGFEGKLTDRCLRVGMKGGHMGMEIVTLENGALLKSIHGSAPSRNSIWYSVYGLDGRLESAREDAEAGDVQTLYVNTSERPESVDTSDELTEFADKRGHGGSDFYTMYNMVQAVRGNKNAEIIDVYEALDMFLPGMFAYFSALEGGKPMDVPNLRNKEEREKWRNDTRCSDPNAAGDMLLPSHTTGDPDIPDSVYQKQKELFIESQK